MGRHESLPPPCVYQGCNWMSGVKASRAPGSAGTVLVPWLVSRRAAATTRWLVPSVLCRPASAGRLHER